MKLGFFPYEALHYKAAQAYLDRKAARGLALKKVYLGCIARLEAAEQPLHFVDLDIRQFLEDSDQDYLQLCADAGWELVQTLRGMLLFRAAPGASPAPIQSDAGMEWERFWKKYARKNIINSLFALLLAAGLLLLLFSLPSSSRLSLAATVTSNSALLYLLFIGLVLSCLLMDLVTVPLYLFRCRRSGVVETPGRFSWFQGTLNRLYRPLYLLAACIALAEILGAGTTVKLRSNMFEESKTATIAACQEYPVVMAHDLGLSDDTFEDYSRYLNGHRSLLCQSYDYTELSREEDEQGYIHHLATEYYDCAWEFIARWVFDLRAAETRRNGFSYIWREQNWENAPGLSFEECYINQDGTCLLIRQDKVVALVACTGVDLTTQENLAIIRQRLGLPAA